MPDDTGLGIAFKLGVGLVNYFGTKREVDSKKKKDSAVQKQKGFIEACQNYTPFDNAISIIGDYKELHNKPLELIYTGDEAYIKYDEDKRNDV